MTRDLINAAWRKSSYSHQQGECVEVGPTEYAVGVRDTKRRESGALAVSAAAWETFVGAVKADCL